MVDPFKSELPDETSPLKAVSELSATPDVFIKRDLAEPTIEDVLVVKSLSCVLAFAASLLSISSLTVAKAAEGVGIAAGVLVTAALSAPTPSMFTARSLML